MTYGLCASCLSSHPNPFATDVVGHARVMRNTFRALAAAGRRADFGTAAHVVEEAIAANCRPVDVLVGIISPLLYEVGEEWKRGVLSVEAEHRFTAFSEKLIRLIEAKSGSGRISPLPSSASLLFLMNAPDNRHTLALRVLSLWLEDRGADVRIIQRGTDRKTLLRNITIGRPKYLLISMAVPDQHGQVAEIAKAVQSLPQKVRPKVVVGGYPVKVGLIHEIPGTELLPNIDGLQIE